MLAENLELFGKENFAAWMASEDSPNGREKKQILYSMQPSA